MAYKASSRRSETPNLSKMLCRWFFTVCSLINIFSAISLFLKPCATKATISRSLWLSRERSRSRLLETGVPAAGASSAPVANCRMTAAVVCESSQISPALTLRMLLINRSVALCFKTMPEVPSFMACTNSFLSSEAVSTITRVLCLLVCSLCSVARPSRPGILRSSSRISGSCVCSTSNTCRPSWACATTSKSGSRASRRHKPSRNMGWSSATTMRIFLGSAGAASEDSSCVPSFSGIRQYQLHFRVPLVLCQSHCQRLSHFPGRFFAAMPPQPGPEIRPKSRNRLLYCVLLFLGTMSEKWAEGEFQRFWKRLQQLGLNAYESRSYLVLLGHPRFKALELAARAHVPRQKIYEVLDSLVEKGFAQVVQERTKLFSAVEPGLALPAYMARKRQFADQELTDHSRMSLALIDDLKSVYSEGQGGRGTLDFLRIVSDPAQTAAEYRRMLSEVRSEYMEFSRPPYAVDPLDERLVKQARLSGVTCRLLLEAGTLDEAHRQTLQDYAAAGVQVRQVDSLPLKLAVFDGRQGMLALLDPVITRPSWTAVVFDHEGMGEAMTGLFEDRWRRGQAL